MPHHPGDAPRSRRDAIRAIDRQILRLLLRRHEMLAGMRNSGGVLDAADEKALREAWQASVARVSRDARLSSRFFSLMQIVDFLPRQEGGGQEASAFNLAPPKKPVLLELTAPADDFATRAWIMLAAAAGQAVRLAPCLANAGQTGLIAALQQIGARLTRDGSVVTAAAGPPLAAADKVFFLGEDADNFFLLLAFYLGRSGRARFNGDGSLKLMDLAPVARFLPELGARLAPVVPKSASFPARVECSGMLPEGAALPPDVPAALGTALLLAAPLFERPFTLDVAAHPQGGGILACALPLLRQAGVCAEQPSRHSVRVSCGMSVPACPELFIDARLSPYLLALPIALGGRVRLGGRWPADAAAQAALDGLRACGVALEQGATDSGPFIEAFRERPATAPDVALDGGASPPLVAALAACVALGGGVAAVPEALWEGDAGVFFHCAGLVRGEGGLCKKAQDGDSPAVWNAPSAEWALALALAACARPVARQGFSLGNPGLVSGAWPSFWSLYNGLPQPHLKRSPPSSAPLPPRRRRIVTRAVAAPPPEAPEDSC